jgi:hypothetical protein
VVVVRAEHEDDRTRLLLLRHLAHVLEPVEDVGSLEPARDPAVDLADRLDHGAGADRAQERLAGDDDERVAGDPEAQLSLGRELLAAGRRRRRCRLLGLGLLLGERKARVDLVVVRAPERGLEPAARLIEEERLARRLQRLRHGEREVALPAFGLDRGRLVEARRVQEAREEQCERGDDDRRPGRVQAAAALADPAARAASSPLARRAGHLRTGSR